MQYVKKGAQLMCTGCPGVIARLDAKKARTVKIDGGVQATEADKKLVGPGFGTCIAIPTAPKKCSAKLTQWMNTKASVKSKGKKPLLFPNSIPCASGPGMVTMIKAG